MFTKWEADVTLCHYLQASSANFTFPGESSGTIRKSVFPPTKAEPKIISLRVIRGGSANAMGGIGYVCHFVVKQS